MFDETSLPTRDDWRAAVRPGDVILFAYPIDRAAPGERPKTRPCLVLDVVAISGLPHLSLAYGTSVDTPANRGEEIAVTATDEMYAAGIDKPTRFVGARRLVVSVDHTGFATCCGRRSPVIGRLTGAARARMDEVRARLAALAERAAERRAQVATRGPRIRAVIVEQRRLGPPRFERR